MSLEETNTEDVDQFLELLRRLVTAPRQTIYRGHANAQWSLRPRAFRPEAKFPTDVGMETLAQFVDRARVVVGAGAPPFPPNHDFRQDLEIGTLIRFFEAADAAGLPLPEDSQVVRAILDFPVHIRVVWPELEIRSILALAQHHGLPTRLLDWTWDWRAAAFFAARDVFDQETQPERLAVWALDADLLESEEQRRRIGTPPGMPKVEKPYRLEIVTAPSATNANLRAQKGLFTLLVPKEGSRLTPDTPVEGLMTGNSLLRKVTLPTQRSRELLRQLACEGVTSASLFPDFNGVVRSLEERSLWS